MRRHLLHLALSIATLGSVADAQVWAITGGRVHTVSGGVLENATVVIRDGRIAAVGTSVAVPADAQRIDAAGRIVTPGFINAGTLLGVVEVGFGGPATDQAARGREQIAASFTVIAGFNPASVLIPPARSEGITSVIVVPSGGLIAGQGAFVDLAGTRVTDFVRRSSVAMFAQIGDPAGAGTGARAELIGKLRELLADAQAYRTRRPAFEQGQSRELAASRADLEALQPVLAGTMPMVIAADRASDIEAALALGREFALRIMIAGGAEAWLVAEELARARVPVLTGAMNNIPGTFSALGQRQENAALLARAGVPVIVVGNAGGGDEQLFNVRNVRFEAGNAVAYGMPYEQALRSVTLAPAQAFGMGDRLGSIEVGKDANLVVWSGDPFEFATRAERVFIRGVLMSGPTRQDLLTERYRTLPPSYDRP